MNIPKKDEVKYKKEEKKHKKKIDRENKHHEGMHDEEMDKAFNYGKKKGKKEKKR